MAWFLTILQKSIIQLGNQIIYLNWSISNFLDEHQNISGLFWVSQK